MILAAYGLLALLTVHIVLLWRMLEERTNRWKLYELRDRLRMAAIEDERVRDSELFTIIDHALTALAGNLREFSLWSILPSLLLYRTEPETFRRAEERVRRLTSQPENAPVVSIIGDATILLVRHLGLRHIFLKALTVGTIVGIKTGKKFICWVSGSVVTRIIEPPERRHVVRVRAA